MAAGQKISMLSSHQGRRSAGGTERTLRLWVQSRAASGRGAAISHRFIALYASQIRVRSELRAWGSQIAVPVGGPAMRGGLTPLITRLGTVLGLETVFGELVSDAQ